MLSASVTNMVRGLIPETLNNQIYSEVVGQESVPSSLFKMSGNRTSVIICGSAYFTGLTDS